MVTAMNPFFFQSPVKAFMGYEFAPLLKQLSAPYSRIAVITGQTSAVKSGFIDAIKPALKDKDLLYFSEIEENPSIETVTRGAGEVRKFNPDCILAFGGGSPLDAAKAIGLMSANPLPFGELMTSDAPISPPPIIAVPGTCGTGSEMNAYSIITDTAKMDKLNLTRENMFPRFAVLEPCFLNSLSDDTRFSTLFDAFSHAFEGFVSKRANPFSDALALHAIEIIFSIIADYSKDMGFHTERALYASAVAGAVILHTGTTILHSLGYYLTNRRGVHHGKANALLLEGYMSMLQDGGASKLGKIREMERSAGIDICRFIRDFYGSSGLEGYVDADDFDDFASYSLSKSNAASTPVALSPEVLKKHYAD